MKISLFLTILFLSLIPLSCVEDRPGPQVLNTSEHSLHFSGNGGSWLLTVNSNAIWQITGTNDWCTVNKAEGINSQQIIITVDTNTTKETRYTTLQITGDRSQASVDVQQDTVSGSYFYQLPVVFHVIYSDINDTIQTVKTQIIYEMIEKCNQVYRNDAGSINMNLELVAAKQDEEGNMLAVPGIHYIQRTTSARQSCENFMKEDHKSDADLMWDPNQYINVYVYTFTETHTLGISHLPFTPRENSLPGLSANNTFYTALPAFPYGISLNNSYIYQKDAYKTLAHELGHYLGLKHTFAENSCDNASDTDYCEDTPSYNRQEYENWLKENQQNVEEQELYQRTGCDGIVFTSRNIMDYDYSYRDQFTADQFLRIRHVLENSPLIPGPKNIIVTKAARETEKPVLQIMK